jgi:deoxyinosine 3'endonuclease (endonuclease V)
MGGRCRPHLRIPGSLEEARAVQEMVARQAAASPSCSFDRATSIAGADASYSPDGRTVHAAVVVLGLPDLELRERSHVTREVPFPYLPGYFAFREGPAIIAAVEGLRAEPDLLLVDGHGRAHPSFATDLEIALAAVLSTTAGSRIPAPLREAHRLSREIRRISLSQPGMAEDSGDPPQQDQ